LREEALTQSPAWMTASNPPAAASLYSALMDSSLPMPKSAYTAKMGARASGALVKEKDAAAAEDDTLYVYFVAGVRPAKSAVQNCAL
jgi:hypothetical protein